MDLPPKSTRQSFFAGPAGWVFCGFVAIALFFLIAEHSAHLGFVVPYLPLALVGLCVVLHSYMHGLGHGRHSDEKAEDENARGRGDHHHQ
jgi:hypothetical protein